MKVVILAAGEGTRMRPLTLKTPKPLLKVNRKSIIDHVFDALPQEITEAIVIIRYLGTQIKKHLGTKRKNINIKYARGSDKGTAYSFLASKKHLKNERFLFIYGDEIPRAVNIKNCLSKELSILVFKSKKPESNGIAYIRNDGTISRIVEKPKKPKSNLATDGVMVLNTNIFKYTPEMIKNEYYFSTMVNSFVREHKVFPVKARKFVGDLTTPADLERVGKILRNEK